MENKDNKTVILGLTGQSGAGKTTASDFMCSFGCFVINSDQVARDIVDKNRECQKKICDCFGKDLIKKDGNLDRKLLSQRVFFSNEKVEALNKITHPVIIAKIKKIINEHISAGLKDIIVIDAPLLFESGLNEICDVTVCVTAPYEIRKNRIMARDNISEDLAKARLSKQHSTSFFVKNCDYCIDSSKDKAYVESQIKRLLSSIKGETQ